jgi:hypothetical protein
MADSGGMGVKRDGDTLLARGEGVGDVCEWWRSDFGFIWMGNGMRWGMKDKGKWILNGRGSMDGKKRP